MNRSSKLSIWLFLVTFVIVFYGTGAAFVESFVNYPTWKLIGPGEFPAYHRAIGPLVIGYMVVPMFIGTIFTAVLIWLRPKPIPAWALWAALVLQIGVWLSTALIQIPIQLELGIGGLSIAAIDRLLVTNFWLRRIPYALVAGLYFRMMLLLLRPNFAAPQETE